MGHTGRGLRGALPALLGVAVSAALLLWAAQGVDLTRVQAYVTRAHLLPLLACIIVATLTFPLRLIRWRLLPPVWLSNDHPAAGPHHADQRFECMCMPPEDPTGADT